MSSRSQSTAAVLRVKGVSFNYLQFLWKKLDLISRTAERGQYAEALRLAVELIPWLPQSLKEEFMKRAVHIQSMLKLIKANGIPQLYKIVDIHQRRAKRNWLLTAYSAASLQSFINNLTTRLDQMGYMENTELKTEGTVDLPVWAKDYEHEKRTKKGGKKEPPAPQGIVT